MFGSKVIAVSALVLISTGNRHLPDLYITFCNSSERAGRMLAANLPKALHLLHFCLQ